MTTPLIALAALAFAAPSLAGPTPRFGSAEWNARGCTLQQVHTPAGKTVQSAPIVRCRDAVTTVAEREPQPGTPRVARD